MLAAYEARISLRLQPLARLVAPAAGSVGPKSEPSRPASVPLRIGNGPGTGVTALGLSGSSSLGRGSLADRLRAPGSPARNGSEDDPRRVSAKALGSVEHTRERRDDPGDRRLSLAIRSQAVESRIKPTNRPRNGTEPFW
jgi:hypothetical protein